MNVADWLRQIGLEQYVQLFAEHDISAEVLPHLTAEDLKDLGIARVGHRRQLLVAIEALVARRRAGITTSPATDGVGRIGGATPDNRSVLRHCRLDAALDPTRPRGDA